MPLPHAHSGTLRREHKGIHTPHKQVDMQHTNTHPGLRVYCLKTVVKCALLIHFTYYTIAAFPPTPVCDYSCLQPLANQWPEACLRHTKVPAQLTWNLDGGATKKSTRYPVLLLAMKMQKKAGQVEASCLSVEKGQMT